MGARGRAHQRPPPSERLWQRGNPRQMLHGVAVLPLPSDEEPTTPNPRSRLGRAVAIQEDRDELEGSRLDSSLWARNSIRESWYEMLQVLGVTRTVGGTTPIEIARCVQTLQGPGGRLQLLSELKSAGLNLPDRQGFANALGRGIRAKLALHDELHRSDGDAICMVLLQAAGFDAPDEAAATYAWGETLDSDDGPAALW